MSEEQLNTETEQEQLETESNEINETESTEPVEGSDTATDNKAEDGPDLQKVIAEKAFEAREQKRRAEELERRLKEIEESKPQETRPNIPPVPDIYDDDFDSKMKARDDAILKQAAFDAQQRERAAQAEAEQRRQIQEQQQQLVSKAQEYSKRAEALGVKPDELKQAGERLSGFVSDDVASYILESDKGPLLTKYLAANPLEVDALSKLNPMQAGIYLEMQVKPKAEQYGVKKPSQAPDPVEPLEGSGAPPKVGPSGATFE